MADWLWGSQLRVAGSLLDGSASVQPGGKSDDLGYRYLPTPVQFEQPLKQPTWYQKQASPTQEASAVKAADGFAFLGLGKFIEPWPATRGRMAETAREVRIVCGTTGFNPDEAARRRQTRNDQTFLGADEPRP